MNKVDKKQHENLLVIIFFLPLINYYLAEILESFNINSLSVYVYVIIYLLAIYSYLYVFKNKPVESTLIICAAGIAFLVTYLVNDKTTIYMLNTSFVKSNLIFFWGLYFPLFLLCLVPINFERLLKLAYRFSVVILILNVISFIIKIYVIKTGVFNYMAFAYSALIPIFVCFYCSIKYRKYLSLILSIVASVIIVIGGSRGALVTMASFYLLYLIIVAKGRTTKGLITKILVVTTLIILALNIYSIINIISKSLTTLGYNSRLFSIIDESSFLESSGRDTIWSTLINEINLFGHGLYGDRVIADDFYAHNWMLELLIDFGIFGGAIAIVSILMIIFMSFWNANKLQSSDLRFIIVCALAILFVKHMLSASYLTSADFWLFLGLAFNIYRFGLKNSKVD